MLQAKWTHFDITNPLEAWDMVKLFKASDHLAAAFDTEADGLHIIHAFPFMFQWGWVTSELKGYTFAIDLERFPALGKQVIEYWHNLVKDVPVYLAHNVKFDLHMLTNFGTPYLHWDNLSDTLFYIRYSHDALTPDKGGPPLKLKQYAAQYILSSAKSHEKLLDSEKSAIAKMYNQKLKVRLASCGAPPAKYKAKSYTLSVIDDMFKDKVFSAEMLPPAAREAYYTWFNDDLPLWLQDKVNGLVDSSQIPYNRLNRQNVTKYAHMDIVWVIEAWLLLNPILEARQNQLGVQIENQLIEPLYNMERVGFDSDPEYLEACRGNVANYIMARREVLYALAGEELKIGQHARIKQIILDRFNIEVDGTDNDTLSLLKGDLMRNGTNKECVEFINVLEELRTLEKWYATYILRFQRELKKGNKLYTTIHQVGTVSGRVTSDFQQFPKKPIKTVDGVELFHPRKLVKVDTAIVYLDYSQIELRFQALYTILVGHPDTNLCRAYMPYACVSEDGTPFDYENPEHIRQWNLPWFYVEDSANRWVATDVHGATTKAAFGIDESNPEYHDLRYVGKRVNFAKNYGAQYKKICTMFPERSAEECRKIDAAYYTAFPGVKVYHSYCYDRAAYAYTTNLFGVRYYNVSGHNLINMLVQGSAAFYLKLKIIELHNFSKAKGVKTKWQMQIHDELSWVWDVNDDPALFFEYKRIMEDWSDGKVPIVADMEVTTTCWAEKEEVSTLAELYQALGYNTRHTL